VIQKMSEMTTQESSDDLDPISERSTSKTLDEDQDSSSSDNDQTFEDDNVVQDIINKPLVAQVVESKSLDSANANLDFQSPDNDNNIPVSFHAKKH
jgi:hypothetical protein